MIAHVASLHYAPVEAQRALYGGYYAIPAVARDAREPVILEVTDKIQKWQGSYTEGGGVRRAQHRDTIFGESIAMDIVKHWTQDGVGMTPECHPAIWVVREHLPLLNDNGSPVMDEGTERPMWRPATAEEKAAMWAEDLAANKAAGYAYAEYLYRTYDAKYEEDPRLLPFFPEVAKLACKAYNFDALWARPAAEVVANEKPCPFCAKRIVKTVIVCPNCHQVVDHERYAIEESKKLAALDAVVQSQNKVGPRKPVTV